MAQSITVFDTFDAAESTWRSLEARGEGFVFQSLDWCRTWFDCVGVTSNLDPILLYFRDPLEHGEAFLPLVVERRGFGVRSLEFAGRNFTDHGAPFLAGPAIPGQRLLEALRTVARSCGADVIDLRHLRPEVGERPNPLISAKSRKASYETHALPLEDSFATFCDRNITQKLRADSRRRRRRLAEQGSVRLVVPSEAVQAVELTATIIDLKEKRFHATGHVNRLDAACQRFILEMTEAHHASGLIHVAALMVDDEVVAGHWGAVWQGTFNYLVPAFRAGPWMRFACGRLLLEDLISLSFDLGLHTFDFTIGDEPYKLAYTTRHWPLFRTVVPVTARGQLYAMRSRLDGSRAWRLGSKTTEASTGRLHEGDQAATDEGTGPTDHRNQSMADQPALTRAF